MESFKIAVESIFDAWISGMEKTLEEHSYHNAIAEVNHRATVLSQREKDRRFRVNAFTQPMAKFHAGNLLNIEAKATALTEHTRLLCPS